MTRLEKRIIENSKFRSFGTKKLSLKKIHCYFCAKASKLFFFFFAFFVQIQYNDSKRKDSKVVLKVMLEIDLNTHIHAHTHTFTHMQPNALPLGPFGAAQSLATAVPLDINILRQMLERKSFYKSRNVSPVDFRL